MPSRKPNHAAHRRSASAAGDKTVATPPGEESRIQKDRYRVLIEEVADGYYEVDLHGNFLFFNDALCRIFGYDRHEIQGRNFRDFMDEKNAQIAYEAFNRIYRTGRGGIDISWEILNRAGQRRYLEISASLITNESGEKTGFRGIARDVSEKYLAQQALKTSEQCALELSQASRRAEQRYRAFLEFLPDPVFVFNLDSTVSYLNPAFEKVFGWTLEELEGRIVPFVPDSVKDQTREGIERMFREKVIHGFETKRLTKDGRILDIVIDGAVFYDENDAPAGQVVTLRDVTREKRVARVNQALFRVSKALHAHRGLNERLALITREVQELLGVEGASVILLDEEKKEFFFREAVYDDSETGQKMKEIRFPVDKGVAGHVYRTGQPLIVPDTSKSAYFFKQVDEQAGYQTRNMLDVPIQIQNRMIGILCAVNKKEGRFDQTDVELLGTIANLVAFPIENASINEALEKSYEEVQSLNRAKDRVIHHLSHELKTPVSILAASLSLLNKKCSGLENDAWKDILDRARRNLDRILQMQYEIEDILREKSYRAHYLLSTLLDVCADELEVLVCEQTGEKDVVARVRQRIEDLFGPREAESEEIRLGNFVAEKIRHLAPAFAHRPIELQTRLESAAAVWIPADVLAKVVEGLVRNAIENTPDDGQIELIVRESKIGPVFEVKDSGVGISRENQRLIFENYFTSYEPMQYSSRQPYDFNAGGRGFDLLRMKIFSERYHFKIGLTSSRCRFIPGDNDRCPGSVEKCAACSDARDCRSSGGTTVTVQFLPARQLSKKKETDA